MKFKDLIKSTEGAIVLGGLALTILSPIFSPELWAIATATAYVMINLPALWVKVKTWFTSKIPTK